MHGDLPRGESEFPWAGFRWAGGGGCASARRWVRLARDGLRGRCLFYYTSCSRKPTTPVSVCPRIQMGLQVCTRCIITHPRGAVISTNTDSPRGSNINMSTRAARKVD